MIRRETTTGVGADRGCRRFTTSGRLVHAHDVSTAVPLVSAALAAAPPGNGGWLLPVEPLLRVGRVHDAWAPALAVVIRTSSIVSWPANDVCPQVGGAQE